MKDTPQVKAERLENCLPYVDPDDLGTACEALARLKMGEDVDTKALRIRIVDIFNF